MKQYSKYYFQGVYEMIKATTSTAALTREMFKAFKNGQAPEFKYTFSPAWMFPESVKHMVPSYIVEFGNKHNASN